tara:strand:+ start:288 stop:545 length:258 start_codon:yes stop_codon:yes gene_type:complete
MLENSLVFSLILSVVNTVFLYLFTRSSTSSNKMDKNSRSNELILLFGITFATSFILKSLSSNTLNTPSVSSGGADALSYSSRPPF